MDHELGRLKARIAQVEQKFRDALEQMQIKDPGRFREITEAVIAQMEAREASGKGTHDNNNAQSDSIS